MQVLEECEHVLLPQSQCYRSLPSSPQRVLGSDDHALFNRAQAIVLPRYMGMVNTLQGNCSFVKLIRNYIHARCHVHCLDFHLRRR